jgi:hypothetical protein
VLDNKGLAAGGRQTNTTREEEIAAEEHAMMLGVGNQTIVGF